MNSHPKLKEFEQQLDAMLTALPSRSWASSSALRIASELYEVSESKDGGSGTEFLNHGYAILASHFVSGNAGYQANVVCPADIKQLLNDLAFASHYYMIREYLYYSYNAPGSMSWTFDKRRVEIKFADKSIPRQFFTVYNDQAFGSQYQFQNFDHSAEIMRLLENEPEGVITPNFEAAYPLLQAEANLKLTGYFSLIAADSQIDLGGYSYMQFLSVYSMLLAKALYHRYLARVQHAVGAIYIPEGELLNGIMEDLGIPFDTGRRILKDLVYDRDAITDRVDATYFSLIRDGEPNNQIVMRPHHFATAEGLVSLLRVIAQRRPQTFLNQVSNEIGHAFVRRVKAAWEVEGFTCLNEVSLREFDPQLPDIDLLVISFEPTLGFVIYVCELKCPLPPCWAKDQLKVLNKDSVSKAFRQVEVLQRFLRTEMGLRFLLRVIPKESHPQFDGFVVLLDSLIITSDNSGMFFGAESIKVINFRTLERLLRRSDGDMALIQHVLATYAKHADETLTTTMVEFQLGPLRVAYEGVAKGPLLEFPQGRWRSSPDRNAMIDGFIAEGAHPFDVFKFRPPDVVVIRTERPGPSDCRVPEN
jgi:hypothetical protein